MRNEEAFGILQCAYEVYTMIKDEVDFYGSIKQIINRFS